MEVTGQRNENLPSTYTSESSPEHILQRSGVRQRPMSLPYRLKRDSPQPKTPESSPERDQGGVRLSPVKLSERRTPNVSTASLGSSPGGSLHNHVDDDTARSLSTEGSQVRNIPEPKSDRSICHHSLSNNLRFPLRRLPRRFFPDASRSVSGPERTPDFGPPVTLNAIAVDGPIPDRQENHPPTTVQGEVGLNEYVYQEPPAYQPRPLNVKRRGTLDKFQYVMPSPRIRQKGLEWIQTVFLDLFFMFLLLAVTGIVLLWGRHLWHQDSRLFPMTFDTYSETWFGPLEFSYPRHRFYLGATFVGVLIPLIPVAVIILMQIWVRSWLDVNAAMFALKKAVVMMLFIQTILKAYIGEFRPFFISTCNPDPAKLDTLRQTLASGPSARKPTQVFANPTYCRNLDRKDLFFAMTSFPSGHTAESFMAGTFLALYLNAKLKPFGDFHTSLWKMLVVVAPLIGAMLVAGSLVADRNHHHHDILLSIPLGVSIAMLAYRTHYASLFNFRTNHLPLPWSSSNQSLNPTVPNSSDGQQISKRAQILKSKGNFAATAWPREPKTYSYGTRTQGLRRAPEVPIQGLDGATDHIHPALLTAGGYTLRRRFGIAKTARKRLVNFSRARDSNRSGSLGRGEVVEPIPEFSFEMRPLPGIRNLEDRTGVERTGADTWSDSTRGSRSGRPSDMV